MGNAIAKVSHCCSVAGEVSRRHDVDVLSPDEGLGHSFYYIRRPEIISTTNSFEAFSEEFPNPATTTFRSISGASVSANTFTPLSTTLYDLYPDSSGVLDRAARFESSTSFASIPLQPVPRNPGLPGSGPAERGFLSGPIERGFMSGPIDRLVCSGPIEKQSEKMERSLSFGLEQKPKRRNLMRMIRRAISKSMNRRHKSAVTPKETESEKIGEELNPSSTNLSSHASLSGNENGIGDFSMESQNLQWAQGKAGEDRVHVVVSDEHGWVFVGIYDGFNGPDAPDYLLSNLYSAVHEELKGLLWSDMLEIESTESKSSDSNVVSCSFSETDCIDGVDKENCAAENVLSNRKQSRHLRNESNEMDNKWEESQRRWKCEWDRERPELDRLTKENLKLKVSNGVAAANPLDVLKALSEALRKTEEAYLDVADKMVTENPELALMGSCVLVMLMKGDDVYLMNVGDSRAVLAQKADPKISSSSSDQHPTALCLSLRLHSPPPPPPPPLSSSSSSFGTLVLSSLFSNSPDLLKTQSTPELRLAPPPSLFSFHPDAYRARGQLILLLETWFASEIFKLGYKSMLKLQASVNSGVGFWERRGFWMARFCSFNNFKMRATQILLWKWCLCSLMILRSFSIISPECGSNLGLICQIGDIVKSKTASIAAP